jgi:hypothetical protein
VIGGKNPFWFYVSNTIALAVIVAGIIFLVYAITRRRFQATIAGLAFLLSGSVVESFYTLKGEVIQVTFLVLSLLSLLLYTAAKTRWQRIGAVFLTVIILLLAYLVKETTIALLPISAVWYFLERGFLRGDKKPVLWSARGIYLAANLISAPLFFLARAFAIPSGLNQGSYTSRYTYQLSQITVSSLRWGGWLLRDFIWVLPLLVLMIILIIARHRLSRSSLLWNSLVWIAAWICIYLPWNFMAEYYMLPFAVGMGVFTSALIVEILPALKAVRWHRWGVMIGIGMTLFLFIGSLLNNLTNARVQLAVDQADAAMMAYLVQNTEPGSAVMVNIQDPNEYFYEMQMQLRDIYGRPDLTIEVFSSDTALAEDASNMYIASPYVVNQPLLTVRMGVIEETQQMWTDSLGEFMREHHGWQVSFETANTFRLTDINYPRILCPFVKTRAFCAMPTPLVDTREFDYGWTVYKIKTP